MHLQCFIVEHVNFLSDTVDQTRDWLMADEGYDQQNIITKNTLFMNSQKFRIILVQNSRC